MDEILEVTPPDADAIQAWLKTFGDAERRRGHALFTSGRVTQLHTEDHSGLIVATVEDEAEVFEAAIVRANQWSGECACGYESCAHQFALGSAVLAEHRSQVVRQLSGSLSRTLEGKPAAAPVERFPQETLEELLKSALGRRLTSTETRYVRELHRAYESAKLTRQLPVWQLYPLGIAVGGLGQQIWPAFPSTELEFWLYIAEAMREAGQELPEFMEPITNLAQIQGKMKDWKRAKEIQDWKSTLGNVRSPADVGTDGSDSESDLRILVAERALKLQWRNTDSEAFIDCKDTLFRKLWNGFTNGDRNLTFEAELIWQLFGSAGQAQLAYGEFEEAEKRLLHRILKMPLLESRVVSSAGKPLQRVPEPLRWAIREPDSPEGDYRFELLQADGSPAPEFLLALPGRPTLYVTAESVYPGPHSPDCFKDSRQAAIPAPALESPAGVGFLRELKVELPHKLAERVRVLPFRVTVACELLLPQWGSEECVVKVSAKAEDGHEESWTGFEWHKSGRKRAAGARKGLKEIVVYDKSAKAEVVRLLQPLNLKADYYSKRLSVRVTRKFPEAFSEWLKTVPPHIQVELKGELASFMSSDVSGSVKLDATEVEIDWFDLRVVLNVEDTSLSPEEIRLLLKAKGRYVRLEGKGWRRLKFDLSEEENERLARLGLTARELSDEPQRLHALQLADPAAKKFLPAEQVEKVQRRAGEIKARVAPDLPSGILAQLRPYQLEGYHFLAYLSTNRFGGILADDMGLGKTLQTLAWVLWMRQPDSAKAPGKAAAPGLVVCPKSVMDNWHAEAAKFAPELRVRCWSAADLRRLPSEIESADLHVLNYSQLRNIGEKLLSTRWLAVVLDEGQYIKNPNSQTAQVARALRAEHRLILTGTPIENRLLDLWSLMSFSMPGVLGTRAQFARLYDSKDDPFARRRLAARVRPFVLRRTKAQVAKDLPDRIEEDLFCEIEGEQSTLYKAELKRAQQLLLGIQTQKELAQHQFHFLTSLLRLRQICCHPKLLNPESAAASAKTEALMEQLEPLMEEGQKVLVFSQFVQMLDILRPAIEERHWPVFYLAGQTENRGELVRQFQSAEGPAVFLISLKAGGFGLNLTAANYVVLFDPWWNPAVENQAIDRTHRIGQTEKVIAYRLLIKSSIEEKIRELQKQKKALAEDVLGEEKFSQSLTLDDLRYLFAD